MLIPINTVQLAIDFSKNKCNHVVINKRSGEIGLLGTGYPDFIGLKRKTKYKRKYFIPEFTHAMVVSLTDILLQRSDWEVVGEF